MRHPSDSFAGVFVTMISEKPRVRMEIYVFHFSPGLLKRFIWALVLTCVPRMEISRGHAAKISK